MARMTSGFISPGKLRSDMEVRQATGLLKKAEEMYHFIKITITVHPTATMYSVNIVTGSQVISVTASPDSVI